MCRAVERLAFEIREDLERTDKLHRCRAKLNGMCKIIERTFESPSPASRMSYIPIRRHVKILQPAHPYDARYDEYFEKRTSDKWKNNSYRQIVTSKINSFQEGKCPCCSEELKLATNWCISLKRKLPKEVNINQIILMSFTAGVTMSGKRKELYM